MKHESQCWPATRGIAMLARALAVAVPVAVLAMGNGAARADGHENEEAEHGGRVGTAPARLTAADAAALAALNSECGSCHIAFPARLLPAPAWQQVMTNLGDHYGTDATLDDPAVAKQIGAFLARNAGDATRYRDAGAPPAGKPAAGKPALPRLTQTRWFLREHDEVRADAWKRPSIKSAANCGACHQGAADGNFSERGIRIPKQ